jgi:hypothetical protein
VRPPGTSGGGPVYHRRMNTSPRVRVGALFVFAFGALAVTPAGVRAAMDVVVTVSPTQVTVGQPVEVLVRTFVPYGADLGLDLPAPRTPFPAPSGYWSVLYAIPGDHFFRVEARAPGGEIASVVVTRDPTDASLYRGIARLPSAGRWRIRVLGYPGDTPGTWAEVDVRPGHPTSAVGAAPEGQRSEQAAVAVSLLAGLAGLAFGFIAGRTRRAVKVDRS